MLKTRVITALVLLAMLVPALAWLPVAGWAIFVLAFVVAAAWEWGRLCSMSDRVAMLYAAAIAVAGVAVLVWIETLQPYASPVLYGISALCWAGIAILWFVRGPAAPRGVLLAGLGPLLLLPCWWAVVQARAAGALFMFLLMALVWVADISAYFAGRRFGRNKLAPAVSPGKTWEGVAGAMAGVAVLALACNFFTTAAGGPNDSWFAWVFAGTGRAGIAGPAVAILIVWAVAGLSILGDLFESLLKRHAGVKDSSALLPGHGGVLDRIDALIPAMPLAMLIFWLFNRP